MLRWTKTYISNFPHVLEGVFRPARLLLKSLWWPTSLAFKRGTSEGRILAGYYDFNANISFTFQAVNNLSAHSTYLRFGLFCKFFSDFGVYLGYIRRRKPNSYPPTWGALLGAFNCLVVFQNFFPFNPSLNFLKSHLNSCVPPPWVINFFQQQR